MEILKIASRIAGDDSSKIDLIGPYTFEVPTSGFKNGRKGNTFETYLTIPYGVAEPFLSALIEDMFSNKDEEDKEQYKKDISESLGEDVYVVYRVENGNFQSGRKSVDRLSLDDDDEFSYEIELINFAGLKLSEENKNRLKKIHIDESIRDADSERIEDYIKDVSEPSFDDYDFE